MNTEKGSEWQAHGPRTSKEGGKPQGAENAHHFLDDADIKTGESPTVSNEQVREAVFLSSQGATP